ncbi:MAG: sel1 repeat family protein [Ruminococcaceae bacterium]|nr:sel1 repeat family protein [Oscillospiraceae bacterium]
MSDYLSFRLVDRALRIEKSDPQLACECYRKATSINGNPIACNRLMFRHIKTDNGVLKSVDYDALYWGGIGILHCDENLLKEELFENFMRIGEFAENNGYYLYGTHRSFDGHGHDIIHMHDISGECKDTFNYHSVRYYADHFANMGGNGDGISSNRVINRENIGAVSYIMYDWTKERWQSWGFDEAEPYFWYRRSADHGYFAALHGMAQLTYDGSSRFVEKDRAASYKYYSELIGQNKYLGIANYRIAKMLIDGDVSSPEDKNDAIHKHLKAAYENRGDGCYGDNLDDLIKIVTECETTGKYGFATNPDKLNSMLLDGVKKGSEECAKRYLELAIAGDYINRRPQEFFEVVLYASITTNITEYAYYRGLCEEKSIGHKGSKKEAKKYYEKAAQKGHKEAAERLKKMKKSWF